MERDRRKANLVLDDGMGHLRDHFFPSRNAHRSVSVEHDIGNAAALDGYIVSPLSRDATLRVMTALVEAHGNRAWTVIGPYGSGKSSFSGFVSALTSRGEIFDAAHELFAEAWPGHLTQLEETLRQLKRPIMTVAVSGGSLGLGATIVAALQQQRLRHQTVQHSRAYQDQLDSLESDVRQGKVNSAQIINAVSQLCEESVAAGFGGVLLLIDEAGKFFERAAQSPNSGDLLLLQALAEACSRKRSIGTLGVILTLHQSIEAYAEGVPVSAQREWLKVSGRFEQIPFLESPRHLLRLTARAVGQRDSAAQLPVMAEHDRRITQVIDAGLADTAMKADLLACRPINPLVARLLGPLFRQRLGQNERSIFAFLGSSEPLGFRAFLERTSSETLRGYTLADLYDYVLANTAVRLSASVGDRTWGAAEAGLRKFDNHERWEVHLELVKAITILSIVGNEVDLRADARTLGYAIERDIEKVTAALQELLEMAVIIFRPTRSAYAIWDGSDLNVGELVRRQRDLVRKQGGIGSRLSAIVQVPPIVGTRHYLQTGTLRVLDLVIRDPEAKSYVELKTRAGADGTLVVMLPDDALSDEAIVTSLTDYAPAKCVLGMPVIYVVPPVDSMLMAHAIDYLAATEVLKMTPALAGDPVGRRDLEEITTRALLGFVEAIEHRLVEPAPTTGKTSRFVRKDEEVSAPNSLGELASDVFDDVFAEAPVVRNEMLNRNHLSTAGAAARRNLIGFMVEGAALPRLGIDGFPPEFSMYASVLVDRLHQQDLLGAWAWTEPRSSSDAALSKVWATIRAALDGAKGNRLPLQDIYVKLALPPHGIREGLSPVLVVAFMLSLPGRAMLYEDNSLVPSLTADVIQRLLRRPGSFDLQIISESKRVRSLLDMYGRALGMRSSAPLGLLDIVKRLLREVSSLSSYAQATQRVTEDARRLRSAIKSARDPLSLLTSRIPEALGIPVQLSDGHAGPPAELEGKLRHAVEELRSADAQLDKAISEQVATVFGYQLASDGWMSWLVSRAAAVPIESIPIAARPLALALGASAAPAYSSLALAAGSATVGKSPKSWTDGDFTAFTLRISELGRSIMAAEALALAQGRLANGSNESLVRVAMLDSTGAELQFYVREAKEGADALVRRQVDAFLNDLDPSTRDQALLHLIRELTRSAGPT
jgi:hypothetical protein